MTSTVSCSSGILLQFPDKELLKAYNENLEVLNVQAYKATRDKYGIWAGNQNKFVSCREELTEWDSTHMEDLYDKYYDTN